MYQEKQHEYELLLEKKEREHEETLAKEQEAVSMYQTKQREEALLIQQEDVAQRFHTNPEDLYLRPQVQRKTVQINPFKLK